MILLKKRLADFLRFSAVVSQLSNLAGTPRKVRAPNGLVEHRIENTFFLLDVRAGHWLQHHLLASSNKILTAQLEGDGGEILANLLVFPAHHSCGVALEMSKAAIERGKEHLLFPEDLPLQADLEILKRFLAPSRAFAFELWNWWEQGVQWLVDFGVMFGNACGYYRSCLPGSRC